jgi:hypothetical protein
MSRKKAKKRQRDMDVLRTVSAAIMPVLLAELASGETPG